MKPNTNITKFINEKIKKQLFESNGLNYDQLDLDYFTKNYIVGKQFKSENQAKEYLASIIDKSDNKTVEDFIIKRVDNTLSPYKIYPNPSELELRRNEASVFIKKYGILSSPDLNHVTHPLYAFLKYKHINKIKDFGVQYKFKPIGEINLDGSLSRFLKKQGYQNTVIKSELRFYNYKIFGVEDEYNMTVQDLKNIKEAVSDLLDSFNDMLGTNFFIKKTFAIQTENSIKRNLINKLSNTNNELNKEYKNVYFLLDRYNEDEFLAIIEMETIDKPKMIK